MNTYNLPWYSGNTGLIKIVLLSGTVLYFTIDEIKKFGKANPDIHPIIKIDILPIGGVYGLMGTQLQNQAINFQYGSARLATENI
ncbi:MAG: hypothetical protein ACRDEB_10125 [Chitinophagaceae bacterium]